jgi:hypothetical protein
MPRGRSTCLQIVKEKPLMYRTPLKPLPSLLQKLTYRSLLRSYPIYQPVFRKGEIIPGSDRNCQDRWLMIKKVIQQLSCDSVADLGCAEGFYVLQAARECACIAVGIDADLRRLGVAQSQLVSERTLSAGFLLGIVDKTLLGKLPRFDMVIFMSVLHHMMYSHGMDYSKDILTVLKPKVGKAMIFEMGQSDEHKSEWSEKLPDMGPNPHEWIRHFLLSCGYSRVTKIGESDSYQKETKRAIFKIEP